MSEYTTKNAEFSEHMNNALKAKYNPDQLKALKEVSGMEKVVSGLDKAASAEKKGKGLMNWFKKNRSRNRFVRKTRFLEQVEW